MGRIYQLEADWAGLESEHELELELCRCYQRLEVMVERPTLDGELKCRPDVEDGVGRQSQRGVVL